MDITRTAPVSASYLVREFSDLRSTLERYDANLTSWVNHGRTYPNDAIAQDYDRLALRFDDARTGFALLHPSADGLNARLQGDALRISRTAGQIAGMAQNQVTFGAGWNTTLDRSIRDAVDAIDLLLGASAAA